MSISIINSPTACACERVSNLRNRLSSFIGYSCKAKIHNYISQNGFFIETNAFLIKIIGKINEKLRKIISFQHFITLRRNNGHLNYEL